MPMRPPASHLTKGVCACLLFSSMAMVGHSAAAATVKTERILVAPQPTQSAPSNKVIIPTGDLRPQPGTKGSDVEPAPEQSPGATTAKSPTDDEPMPTIVYGDDSLPKPVQRIRDQMMEAAASGDIERLRPVLEANEVMPTLAFDTFDDPIEYLKHSSGDPEGREILAILSEVLEAGWVHADVGTPQEMYVWPYFARYPLDKLDARQMVELFKIITAGDLEDMKTYGAYNFYRLGIAPDGTWHYFVAGD